MERVVRRQLGVSRRVLRILLDGEFEILDRLVQADRVEVAKVVKTLDVGVIGFGADRGGAPEATLTRRRHGDLNLPGDGPCHLPLYLQDVAQSAVIALRPQVGLVADLNPLRADTNPSRIAALVDVPHPVLQLHVERDLRGNLAKGKDREEQGETEESGTGKLLVFVERIFPGRRC
jgi:hypothetical protein